MRSESASSPVKAIHEGDTRFAVVTMTRMPYRFEEWLNYYRALGTDHLFIAVEESPEVESLLAEAPWCDMVTTSRSKPEQNPYETVITRQERVMAWALGECESRGIPWLFHLDDDELLHFGQPWEETVAQVPPEATCLVVRNVEGVPDNDHSDFTTISRFAVGNETGWPMLAYINGKAAGRVGACSEMGPHRFTGADCPAAPPPRRPRRLAAPAAPPPRLPARPAAPSPTPACHEPAPPAGLAPHSHSRGGWPIGSPQVSSGRRRWRRRACSTSSHARTRGGRRSSRTTRRPRRAIRT